MPGAVFSGSMDGHLRAYATTDGKILWDSDTARELATVNGVTGKGGALDAGGGGAQTRAVSIGPCIMFRAAT
jgi:polyvinyl alcohol dehydrogenase (cytochrome)